MLPVRLLCGATQARLLCCKFRFCGHLNFIDARLAAYTSKICKADLVLQCDCVCMCVCVLLYIYFEISARLILYCNSIGPVWRVGFSSVFICCIRRHTHAPTDKLTHASTYIHTQNTLTQALKHIHTLTYTQRYWNIRTLSHTHNTQTQVLNTASSVPMVALVPLKPKAPTPSKSSRLVEATAAGAAQGLLGSEAAVSPDDAGKPSSEREEGQETGVQGEGTAAGSKGGGDAAESDQVRACRCEKSCCRAARLCVYS